MGKRLLRIFSIDSLVNTISSILNIATFNGVGGFWGKGYKGEHGVFWGRGLCLGYFGGEGCVWGVQEKKGVVAESNLKPLKNSHKTTIKHHKHE